MPENCPCENEPRDCPVCEVEAEHYRQLILEAVAGGEVSEEEVMRTVFGIKKANLN